MLKLRTTGSVPFGDDSQFTPFPSRSALGARLSGSKTYHQISDEGVLTPRVSSGDPFKQFEHSPSKNFGARRETWLPNRDSVVM